MSTDHFFKMDDARKLTIIIYLRLTEVGILKRKYIWSIYS